MATATETEISYRKNRQLGYDESCYSSTAYYPYVEMEDAVPFHNQSGEIKSTIVTDKRGNICFQANFILKIKDILSATFDQRFSYIQKIIIPQVSKHFQDRINELKKLKAGWYDNEQGTQFSALALDHLTRLYASYYPHDGLEPHIYPTPENSVQLDWDIRHWRITLEIALDTLKGEFYALELGSDEEVFRDDLDMNRAQDWQWVSKWLQAKQAEVEA